mmetsp:Transcript_46640/g.131817  ORF Transcript_46640/g.131817 Transcript_46640/m.131817 type:complete len:201 (-) Transcript_46640:177-779(-)
MACPCPRGRACPHRVPMPRGSRSPLAVAVSWTTPPRCAASPCRHLSSSRTPWSSRRRAAACTCAWRRRGPPRRPSSPPPRGRPCAAAAPGRRSGRPGSGWSGRWCRPSGGRDPPCTRRRASRAQAPPGQGPCGRGSLRCPARGPRRASAAPRCRTARRRSRRPRRPSPPEPPPAPAHRAPGSGSPPSGCRRPRRCAGRCC